MIQEQTNVQKLIDDANRGHFIIVVIDNAAGKLTWTGSGFQNIEGDLTMTAIPHIHLKSNYLEALTVAKENFNGTIEVTGF
jgi:uncharacterized protein YggL (DUF469 family)